MRRSLVVLVAFLDTLLYTVVAGTLRAHAAVDATAVTASATATATGRATKNPLLDKYRQWAEQYEADAKEAEAAAEKYSSMTQAVAGGTGANRAVIKELKKLKAKDLAKQVWSFEAKLRDPRPVNAAAAAEAAARPYREEWKEYTAARNSYLAAAAQHALRAKANGELAEQLQAHSDQNKLEGTAFKAETYHEQASALMKQVAAEQDLAKEYNQMADKISGHLPGLWKMAFTAANYAAYQENPWGSLPSTQLLPYTVAPPPADLVYRALAEEVAQAAAAARSGVPR
mmetsp:Transcript_73052/g.211464  ORF Transcript_73052/g.211464 Transcript_73052/m.211464 type:complete len:286 (-) Transcript_73052:36-893(-)